MESLKALKKFFSQCPTFVFLSILFLSLPVSGFGATYQLNIDSPSITEGDSGSQNLNFTVSISPDPAGTSGDSVTVDWISSDGSANSGVDYTASTGTLTFDNGSGVSQTISIAILGDTVVENAETLIVTLSNATVTTSSGSTATITTASGTGTIVDNDYTAEITSYPNSQAETTSPATFVITLTPSITGGDSVTVNYATSDGTAIDGTDITSTSGSVTFNGSNPTTQTVAVPIISDSIYEGDETYTFSITPGTGSVTTPGVNTVTATITDPYSATLSSDIFVNEAYLDTSVDLTVTLDRINNSGSQDITIDYTTSNGSASAGSDYTTTSGTLTFNSGTGSASQTITIPILADAIIESAETFTLTISNPSPGADVSISDSSATVTISDNASDYTVSLQAPFTKEEGSGDAQFLITTVPSIATGEEIVISYTTVDGTALAGSDYTATSNSSLTLTSADPNPFTVSVPITADAAYEGSETFTLLLGKISDNVSLGTNPTTCTIQDHDFTIAFAGNVTVQEGTDPNAVFTVQLDRAPLGAESVTVNYAITPGSATSPSDYTTQTGTLTFDAGSGQSLDITVPIIDDALIEGTEDYTVTLSTPSVNASITTLSATGSISDDDYTASISDATVNEDDGVVILTVSLDRNVDAGDTVSFTYSTADGTVANQIAEAGNDYTAATNIALDITAGNNSGTITIPILNDALVEFAEQFTVSLTPTSGNVTIASPTATVTINVEEKYQFSIDDVSIVEANTTANMTITVTPAIQAGHSIDITASTSDGTATQSADYTQSSNTITFTSGMTTATFAIPIIDDILNEGLSELFYINLTAATPTDITTITDPQGVLTIIDTDYYITPSWNLGGDVTFESPVGTTLTIVNGSPHAVANSAVSRFTVTADNEIESVLIDGLAPTNAAITPFVTTVITDAKNHTYTFEANTSPSGHTIAVLFRHRIDMTADSNGTIERTSETPNTSVSGSSDFVLADHNSNQSFTITGDADQCVTDLNIDGSSIGPFQSGNQNWDMQAYTFTNVATDHSIEATFGQATITVQLVASDPALNSTIQSNATWSACLATDSTYSTCADFMTGQAHNGSFTVPINTPCDSQYIRISFTDTVDGFLVPNPIDLDLNSGFIDSVQTGTYLAKTYVLTLATIGNGYIQIISPDPQADLGSGKYIFLTGETVNITPNPDPSWSFNSWTTGLTGNASPAIITITQDTTLTAEFIAGCEDKDNDGYTLADPLGTGCATSALIDCDDNNPDIHPNATEICGDGVDQDCSGDTDNNGVLNFVDDLICSGNDFDNDGDGFTENEGDCDDTNTAINRGAYDIPGNGIDEDCYDGDRVIGSELTCINVDDEPADVSMRPAPPLIMFLLDDSGSMDWEFMTDESAGLYSWKYYLLDYDQDVRAYNETHALSLAERREWLSQWSGYNRIYYDQAVTRYKPWPYWTTIAGDATVNELNPDPQGFMHADMDSPRTNTVDAEDGDSWDGSAWARINLNDTFFSVMVSGQQVMVTRGTVNNGGSTLADAVGLSTNANLQQNSAADWTTYNASTAPEFIYDNADGTTIFNTSAGWSESGGLSAREWAGSALYNDGTGDWATWTLILDAADAGDYYVYVWNDEYNDRDRNAVYTVSYYNAGILTSTSFTVDQRGLTSGGTGEQWFRLGSSTFPFIAQSSGTTVNIPIAHYFVWDDSNANGTRDNGEVYLITLPGSGHSIGNYSINYYRFNDVNSNDSVDDGELFPLTGAAIPNAIKPVRYDDNNILIDPDTDTARLAYFERQNFADWFSFYRRRMLTAKSAVGLTVEDMEGMELGIHTLNQSFSFPLDYIQSEGNANMITYLSRIYNLNPVGGTRLRGGLHDVGKYFQQTDTGDVGVLKTSDGLNQGTCSGDTSVFYDAQNGADTDLCDDTGGECQRAYVIAMTDGYYNNSFDFSDYGNTVPNENVDGSENAIFSDTTANTLADISMHFYNLDLDTTLANNLSVKNYDTQTAQHLVTYGVSFGVFGRYNPDLFPDCLPECEAGVNGCPQIDQLSKIDSSNCVFVNGVLTTCDDGTGTQVAGPFANSCPDWYEVTTDTNQTIDDLYHASVNSRGKFLNAANPDELIQSMKTIKDLITAQIGSASSVALNAKKLKQGALVYQAIYNSEQWSGNVVAKCLSSDGYIQSCDVTDCQTSCDDDFATCMTTTCPGGEDTCQASCETLRQSCLTTNNCDNLGGSSIKWNADAILDPDPSTHFGSTNWYEGRNILTMTDPDANPATENIGVQFTWSNLPSAYKIALDIDPTKAEAILEYIRGEDQYELASETNNGTSVYNFRDRSTKFGDFIHSEPYHFSNSTLNLDMVFVGSNEGMLHAFNGPTGDEIFSYIPGIVFDNLQELPQSTYNNNHRYFVDGYMFIKDVGNSTILVGGLGKGGKGFYSLDLTALSSTITTASAASDSKAVWASNADSIVNWEYSNVYKPQVLNATLPDNDVGYSFSRPEIAGTNDTAAGDFMVVFGNGYESENGHAVLYLLGLDNDGNIAWEKKIDTGVGGASPDCNGLSTPALIDPDFDGKIDFIYAGDLLGNMWKFDVRDNDRNNWSVYFEDGSSVPQPLIQVESSGGVRQPITSKPNVTGFCEAGTDGFLVVFGTGRLLGTGTISGTGTPLTDSSDLSVQSMYAIYDWSPEWESNGNPLSEQKFLGVFGTDTGATSLCQISCENIRGASGITGTCIDSCNGNTDCETLCIEEEVSCKTTCNNIRSLSNVANISETSGFDEYVTLLQQTQVYIGGINYDSTGKVIDQVYGADDTDAFDVVTQVFSDNSITWLTVNGISDFDSDPNKTARHLGWYIDLPTNGGRVINDPEILDGKVLFTNSVPSDSPCEGGGESWILTVDYCSGGQPNLPFFDLNGDGYINKDDLINIGTLTDPIYVVAAGFKLKGLTPAPTIVEKDGTDKIYYPTSENGDESIPIISDGDVSGYNAGAVFWRELEWK